MSRTLKRPMFKRGGTPNTGIMDGFNDGGRVGFQGGGSDIRRQMLQFGEREEQQPTTTIPVFQDTLDDTMRQAPDEPIMDLADYASLFKLGAGIAGAPGRGTGLGGVLAASSETP